MKKATLIIVILLVLTGCCPKFPEKDFTEQNNFILNFFSNGNCRTSSEFLEFYFHTRFAKMNNIIINNAYQAETVDKVIPTVVSYEYDKGILSKILVFELNDFKKLFKKESYRFFYKNDKDQYLIKDYYCNGDSTTVFSRIYYCGKRISKIERYKTEIHTDYSTGLDNSKFEIDYHDTSGFTIAYIQKNKHSDDELLYKFKDLQLIEVYENASNYPDNDITWDESGYQKKYSIEYDEQYQPKYYISYYSFESYIFAGHGRYVNDTTTVFFEWQKDSLKAYELPKDNSGEKKLVNLFLLNDKGLPTKHVEYWHDYDTTYTRITEYEYEYIGEGQQESK